MLTDRSPSHVCEDCTQPMFSWMAWGASIASCVGPGPASQLQCGSLHKNNTTHTVYCSIVIAVVCVQMEILNKLNPTEYIFPYSMQQHCISSGMYLFASLPQSD